MKKMLFVFLISISVIFTSCKGDDDGVSPNPPSIEQKINEARPFSDVKITLNEKDLCCYERTVNDTSPFDAFAENGYFIVSTYKKEYFNLSLAKQIIVNKGAILIKY
ncbi:MAG: hypothetical protein ACM34K_00420 [Bacillota bacterium]